MNEKVGNLSFPLATAEDMDIATTKPYSEKMAELIDSEVQLLISSAFERTMKLLRDHKDDVLKV